MVTTKAYDVEVTPNFFSITIVDVKSYLTIFKDCVNEKGKPVPLTDVLTVKEIKERLDNVECKSFYITDTDDDQLLPMLSYISAMEPQFNHQTNDIDKVHMFGYNSSKYDKYMVACFLMYARHLSVRKLIDKLYELSQLLIKDREYNSLIESIKQLQMPYTDVDVMSIFALNKVGTINNEDGTKSYFGKALKQTSINLKWYELLEYHLPDITEEDAIYYKEYYEYGYSLEQLNISIGSFERYILDKWIEPTMHYNKNDTFIVCEIMRLNIDEIISRYEISKLYKINVLNSSRSNIADVVFNKFYSEFSNLHYKQWAGKITERTRMSFKRVIFDVVQFKTEYMIEVLNELKKIVVTGVGKQAFEKIITINKTQYTMATGGIHSKDIPRELKSKLIYKDGYNETNVDNHNILDYLTDESYIYRHWDISSFYPALISQFKICPEHLNTSIFVKLVNTFTENRIKAKGIKSDKVEGISKDVYILVMKILLNSLYGKLNYEYGNLCDKLALLKVTINGQLLILMLCEELEANGIEVVSANTDGIVIKLYPKDKDLFNKIADDWKATTGLKAESEDYKMYVCRDINNYFAQEFSGKFTYKGAMNPKLYLVDLSKGYDMPIVAEAVVKFFTDNIDPLDTLYGCTNILDFCKTQNVGRQYHVGFIKGLIEVDDDSSDIQKVQRYIRYYVSNNGGVLLKVHNQENSKNRLSAGNKVTICNSLDDMDISLRNINYQYYYNECFKIINAIKLGISTTQKGIAGKTKSGKALIKKYSAQFNTLFDD